MNSNVYVDQRASTVFVIGKIQRFPPSLNHPNMAIFVTLDSLMPRCVMNTNNCVGQGASRVSVIEKDQRFPKSLNHPNMTTFVTLVSHRIP